MQIKPILHRILVKPDVLEEVDEVFRRAKAAGLAFDFSEREREQAAIDTGTVLSFGPTAFRDFGADNPLKVGDKVVYAKYGGKAIVDPETKIKYVALNDEDVIAIVTKEGA
jgi:co-chaperonin GroES (HSP10)